MTQCEVGLWQININPNQMIHLANAELSISCAKVNCLFGMRFVSFKTPIYFIALHCSPPERRTKHLRCNSENYCVFSATSVFDVFFYCSPPEQRTKHLRCNSECRQQWPCRLRLQRRRCARKRSPFWNKLRNLTHARNLNLKHFNIQFNSFRYASNNAVS